MLSDVRGKCVPRVIAVYIALYAIIARMPLWYDWWSGRAVLSTPAPTPLIENAASIVSLLLLFWIILSYFVWRRHPWSRWAVAYSALGLGVLQCVLYRDMFRLYVTASLISEMLVEAVPTFFLAALLFCPFIGQCFVEKTHLTNRSSQP
jgi:hypothetical protein